MKNTILILILLPTLYINYLVYKSYVVQYDLLSEFNSQKYTEETTASFNTLNTDFPNIGVTTIPIDHLISKYYFLSEDYEKAFSLIESGNKANPFLKAGALFKSEIYDHLGVRDSALFYSKEAFTKMPRTPRHFLFYAKNLVKVDSLNELLKAYKQIENENDTQFHSTFIVSLNEFIDVKKKDSLNGVVLKLKQRFIDSEIIRVSVDHYLYGIDNVKKSIEFSKIANDFFSKSMFYESLNNFTEASELNPGDYTNFENTAYIYIQLEQYDKAIPILLDIIKNKFRSVKGKSEFLLGLSYVKTNNKEEGCKYLNISKKLNFPDSYSYINKFCK